MMNRKGLLIVVSGPSGAGKGTVLKRVFTADKSLTYSISVTTRQPRKGEVDGVNYFFKTKEEYLEMVTNEEFLETQKVYDNYYGTPRAYVEELRNAGKDVVLEIDVKGALEVSHNVSDAILIFLTPKSKEVLRNRLRGRATETEEQLKIRTDAAISEFRMITGYDYVVINNNLDDCVKDVLGIINAERHKVACNGEFIKKFLEGDN